MSRMEKGRKINTAADSLYEGRDKAYMDIDRMVNEGLAGGAVHQGTDGANIEESQELIDELPPNKWD